jgi:hypothetical protein
MEKDILDTKAGFRPKFQSEFSMGQLDFERFNQHLKFIEYYCGVINSTDIPTLEMIQNYFAGLVTLYKLWRPIIAVPKKVEDFDNIILLAKDWKRRWEKSTSSGIPFSDVFKIKLADILDIFHTKLMDIKQVIGLGISVKKNLSTSQKIKAGVKGHMGMFENLPEA